MADEHSPNYSQIFGGVLRGEFWWFGCPKGTQTLHWPRLCISAIQGCPTVVLSHQHGLSQQGVWVPFWTPKPLKRTPQDTQIFVCGIIKNLNLKLIFEFFHLLIIPMTLINDIMPYFDEFICLWLKYEYIVIPLKILDAQNFYNCQF